MEIVKYRNISKHLRASLIKLLLRNKCNNMQAYLLGHTVQIKLEAKLKLIHLEQCICVRVSIVHFVVLYVLQIVRAFDIITFTILVMSEDFHIIRTLRKTSKKIFCFLFALRKFNNRTSLRLSRPQVKVAPSIILKWKSSQLVGLFIRMHLTFGSAWSKLQRGEVPPPR